MESLRVLVGTDAQVHFRWMSNLMIAPAERARRAFYWIHQNFGGRPADQLDFSILQYRFLGRFFPWSFKNDAFLKDPPCGF